MRILYELNNNIYTMKLFGYTFTYNEEEMIKYVMPYVELLGYDKFIVYDNYSTDNTVEELKKYPFVEIRYYDTNGCFDDEAKTNLIVASYVESNHYAYKNNETVFFTITDFDEVIFCNDTRNFKYFLERQYTCMNRNVYCGNMLNLTPKFGLKTIDLCDSKLVHSNPNVVGGWWEGGYKPTILCANDISFYNPSHGNHACEVKTYDDKQIHNLDDSGCLFSFHLKYIDYQIYKRHILEYMQDRGRYDYSDDIDSVFYGIQTTSFPLSLYFANKHRTNYGSGIVKIWH